MGTIERRWQLAACYRATYLSLALFDGSSILELRRHRVLGGRDRRELLEEHLLRLAEDYAVEELIVEPRTELHAIARRTSLKVKTLTLEKAKAVLRPSPQPSKLPALFDELVEITPKLRRFVRLTAATNQVATSDRWRTVSLLAVALGLAAHALERATI